MSTKAMKHNRKHQELIHSLVEENLAGEEQRQAESNLLSCPECLDEYNAYRKFWRLITSEDYMDHWASYLKDKNPERYSLYTQIVGGSPESIADEITYRPNATSGYWASVRMWRTLTLALALIWVLIVPIGVHKLVTLNKGKDQRIIEERQRVEALSKKAEEFSRESQKQAEQIGSLHQRIQKYLNVGPNEILSVPFFAGRGSEDVKQVEFTKESLFLNFQVWVPEEKEYKMYSLVIADRQGKVLLRKDRIRKGEYGLSWLLSVDLFKGGDYVLKVYGIDRGQSRLLSQYRFRMVTRT